MRLMRELEDLLPVLSDSRLVTQQPQPPTDAMHASHACGVLAADAERDAKRISDLHVMLRVMLCVLSGMLEEDESDVRPCACSALHVSSYQCGFL